MIKRYTGQFKTHGGMTERELRWFFIKRKISRDRLLVSAFFQNVYS